MTRKSKREIEASLDQLEDGDDTDDLEVVVRDHVVDENGDVHVVSGFRRWRDESDEWHTEELEFDVDHEIDPDTAEWSVE